MATLQKKGNTWFCQFMFKRDRFTFSVGQVEEMEARSVAAKADYILMRLKQNLLTVPPSMTLVEFIRNDGKAPPAPTPPPKPRMTFAEFRDAFLRVFGNGAVEDNTLSTARIHLSHFAKSLGETFPIKSLNHADLQKHIERRQKDVKPVTLKKEIDTLKAAWNWGTRMEYVQGAFPSPGLVFPKETEREPFQTWAEIERRVKAGADDSLWDCLFLSAKEMAELLKCVKTLTAPPWFYPMLAFACHTGARKSEMMRSQVQDIDLASKWITIREKKKTRGKLTTRRVPMSAKLAEVMSEWLSKRDGQKYLFAGRKGMLTVQAVQKAFARVLKKTKWNVLKGWHCCRHSFISAMACKSIDQRIIQDIVGHLTADMARRYTHLYPSTKEDAIKTVLG